jgi:hypothetical protein
LPLINQPPENPHDFVQFEIDLQTQLSQTTKPVR